MALRNSIFILLTVFTFTACQTNEAAEKRLDTQAANAKTGYSENKLSEAALLLTKDKVVYDPQYFTIAYPNGDVPAGKGVCTDVVIRAYRKLDIDLQRLVHEDMQIKFSAYPKTWALSRPDPNIDHRRVPNLMTFFKRKNAELPISQNGNDYQAGDVVAWMLDGGLPHIGIVVRRQSADGQRPLIVHNIGAGQVVEDCIFKFKIIGHYRYKI